MLCGTVQTPVNIWRSMLSTACVILCITSAVSAYTMTVGNDVSTQNLLDQLARDNLIHVDNRPPPLPILKTFEKRDISRDNTTSSVSTTVSASKTSATFSSRNSTLTTTTSSTLTSATATYTATSLPQPFDTSIGNNFTASSCPAFLNSFLSNSTFKACMPISLLLQNSLSFFQAVRSPAILTETLDTSCSASLAICSPLMSSIATNLIDLSNCGGDYQRQNPIVSQAYAGLLAYEPMYKASCLKDPSNSTNYCFAEALTNSSNPSDSYPYYTAIGIQLPLTAVPSCTSCLQETMTIFAGYAKMKDQPLSGTYMSCATHIDSTCGASFANTNVQVATTKKSNASPDLVRSSLSIIVTAVVAVSVLLTII